MKKYGNKIFDEDKGTSSNSFNDVRLLEMGTENVISEPHDVLNFLSQEGSNPSSSNMPDLSDSSLNSNSLNLGEGVILHAIKFKARIFSKVLGFNQETVTLECLMDEENKIYNEIEFDIIPFQGFELRKDKIFIINYYYRPGQGSYDIIDNPKLIPENIFPNIDFEKEFKGSSFTKKKD